MDDYIAHLLDQTLAAYLQYEQLQARLSLPETAADGALYRRLQAQARVLQGWAAAHSALRGAVDELQRVRTEQRTAEAELLPLYREEETRLSAQVDIAVAEIQSLLAFGRSGGTLPCVVTLRPDGAASKPFVREVAKMYRYYLAAQEVACTVDEQDKLVTLRVAAGGYGRLRAESGTHKRVQGGALTLAVMPTDLPERVEIRDEDVRVDIFCASGKGGQNINKVETAVRITHLPTGTVTVCQDERSQLANKRRAMQHLQERLQAELDATRAAAYVAARDDQVRDRSNAVRVYDEQKNTLRDPRTKVQVPLDAARKGDLQRLIVAAALWQNKGLS